MTPLLARLRAPEAALNGQGAEAALRASILEHLRNMCVTRRGSVRTRPDYGLPDIGELVHSFPEAIGKIRDALLHTVETYEPRLKNVRIAHVPSAHVELMIRFEIRATLADSPRSAPVRFETQLNASRAVDVV
jgi:type VI secretion system protein